MVLQDGAFTARLLESARHMEKPDYQGGSIVNLMASIAAAFGAGDWPYPPLRGLPPEALAGSRNIALLVIDGLGHHLLASAAAGAGLRRHLAGSMTSVFPPTTASAIPVFHTGLAPQQHALTGWYIYFRELGSVTAVLPLKPRHGGQALGREGLDLTPLFPGVPIFPRLAAQSWVVTHDSIIDSDFNRVHSTGAQRLPYHSLHQLLARMEEAIRSGPERKFLYGYYPELDAQAHVHGTASAEVQTLLAKLDQALGGFLEALGGTDTTVIITADHGFIDADPAGEVQLEQHPDLARCLLLPLCGERRTAYCYVEPGRRRDFEAYVREALAGQAELVESERLVDEGWFGLGPPHPRLLERIGHYTLLMRGRCTIKDWILGERPHRHVGVHGGLSAEEMNVPLIVARC